MDQYMENVQKSYDQVADEYTSRFFHELEHKPLDRGLLDCLAEEVRGMGLVGDLGCGPGHVARYLHERGVSVLGIDLSPRMVELARQLNPAIEFQQGNMAALDVKDEAWVGIVAFYSMIHLPRSHVVPVLREFYRVLRPNGLLLLSFHQGQEARHVEEWWGKPVSLDGVFFEREEMEGYLQEAGFVIEVSMQRAPYAGIEVQTQRVYILMRKLPQVRKMKARARVQLTEDMKRVVNEQRLGFIASVCPDGTPNLSPKGTTAVWDDEHLIFADICSPGTIANVQKQPMVEINVVDPVVRKGYRFKGPATVYKEGPMFERALAFYRNRGTVSPIEHIVLVKVERVLPLISPAYDQGKTEEEIRKYWLEYWETLYHPGS